MTRAFMTLNELRSRPIEEIRRIQDRKFKAMIRYRVWPSHPYYRRMFKELNVDPWSISCIDDWRKRGLPLTRKLDYKEHIREFVINPTEADGEKRAPSEILKLHLGYTREAGGPWLKLLLKALKAKLGSKEAEAQLKEEFERSYMPLTFWFSSGRVLGLPTPVFLTKEDFETMALNSSLVGLLAIEPWVKKYGFELRAMNLFPYAPHLGWWGVDQGLYRISKFLLRTAAGGVIPTERLVQLAELFKVNGYAGMPAFIRNRFCRELLRQKPKLPEVGVVLLAGEKLYDRVFHDIKEAFAQVGMEKSRVVCGFAASETKTGFAAQCTEQGPYHNLSPMVNAYRVVKLNEDGTYDFIEEGEGGLLTIFHLDGAGTVFEGYLLGDRVEKHWAGKCEHCGVNSFTFHEISRVRDYSTQLQVMGILEKKVKGATINLTSLRSEILNIPEVFEAQIVITKEDPEDPYSMDKLEIYAATVPGADPKKAKSEIMRATKMVAEITPHVEILDLEELIEKAGGLKFLEIVDKRPAPS